MNGTDGVDHRGSWKGYNETTGLAWCFPAPAPRPATRLPSRKLFCPLYAGPVLGEGQTVVSSADTLPFSRITLLLNCPLETILLADVSPQIY